MKKLFFLLSVAVMVMATSCKPDNSLTFPVNDGEENPIYTYYSATQNLCCSSIATVDQKLTKLGLTAAGTNKYQLVGKEYVVTIDYVDVDSNETIDIFNVTFTPAEQKHDAALTFDCIKKFVGTVGNSMKLFATPTQCRFYGFYSANGTWLGAMGDVNGVFGAVNEQTINNGYAFWVENSVETYDPSLKAPNEFTGMYLKSTAATGSTTGEYNIVLSYVINQTLAL